MRFLSNFVSFCVLSNLFLLLIRNFENGLEKGTHKEYHSNGKLSVDGNWNIDKPIGKVKMYTKKGELQAIITIDSLGNITSEKIFKK